MPMRLSNDRYEEIKIIVVDLFEKCNIHCTPISGYEIAVNLGIKVIPYSALTPSKRALAIKICPDGFSAFDNGEWRICVNDDCRIPYGRINFTLLHELGHIILEHTEDSALADAEADFFAKFAQCPPVLVHELRLRDVGEVMDRFGVTYGAACYALSYYKKWLLYGGNAYTDYEIQTRRLFGYAV